MNQVLLKIEKSQNDYIMCLQPYKGLNIKNNERILKPIEFSLKNQDI